MPSATFALALLALGCTAEPEPCPDDGAGSCPAVSDLDLADDVTVTSLLQKSASIHSHYAAAAPVNATPHLLGGIDAPLALLAVSAAEAGKLSARLGLWITRKQSDGAITIENAHSGRRLYAQEGKTGEDGVGADNGPTVYADQKWNLEPQEDGTYTIVNAHNGRRLYAQKDKTWADGVGADNGPTVYADQKWIIPMPSAPATEAPTPAPPGGGGAPQAECDFMCFEFLDPCAQSSCQGCPQCAGFLKAAEKAEAGAAQTTADADAMKAD